MSLRLDKAESNDILATFRRKCPSFLPRGFAERTRVCVRKQRNWDLVEACIEERDWHKEAPEARICWVIRSSLLVMMTIASVSGTVVAYWVVGNNLLVQVQAMGQLVRVVVGEWQRLAHGTWRFDMDHTQVKYDIVLRENETYGDLVSMVRGKYRVLPSEPVALTYDFPEWMKVPGDYTTPPVDILEDKDVELFMAEFGVTEDGTDVVPPKPIPWRGFRSGDYLQVSEEKMMTICSSEQMVEIRRNAVRVTRDEIFQPLMVIDENSSQTDSSDEIETFRPNAEGMIRLEEITTEPPGGANLTLTIATTDNVDGGRVGSYGKGKGVMMGPDITGVQLFGLQMGFGSGYANTEEANVAIEEDVGYAGEQKVSFPRNGEEEMESNNQLYVGQVFVDRDALKVYMSLHALAKRYRYFVRKSEPGKVVLECSGVNYQWRVYATKIMGCPRFEIKTLDSNHRCSVSERDSLYTGLIDEIFIPETLVKNRRLRTLLFIKSGVWYETGLSFTRLKLVRVLDVSCVIFLGWKVPSSSGKLIHLRYLSLKDAFVTHLPSSMRNLKQLLYMNLCVNSSFSLYMPNFLKELRELTYLCLPRKIQKKVKMELANLVKLETLENFPTEHGNVRDLQGMTRLMTLSIYIGEDPMPILEKLHHLKEVRLGDRSFCGSRMVCSMGGFPQLQKLSMTKLKEWEMWIVEEGSMPLLLFLDIDCCGRLEEWILEEGSMPLLRILDIICCDKLELPDGLQFITSLAPQSAAEGGSQQLRRCGQVVGRNELIETLISVLSSKLDLYTLVLDLSSIHWETHCQISKDSSSSPHILILVKFGKLRSSKGVQKCVVQVKDQVNHLVVAPRVLRDNAFGNS
ncbi:hypothetical protein DY000_02012919 [Brassica cretica]|uniref:Transposase MuDR plant domain-containing protein n=1 Tax=Brassica cretica TaxID=69181 RepID=A0ABQ7CNS4_BRACR|nr:hypothetical protein DY000_02012919 [Brassica cretica]